MVLLSIDALSPQKGTYIVHFVSLVLKKMYLSNHHISHLVFRVDMFWRAVAVVLRRWQNKNKVVYMFSLICKCLVSYLEQNLHNEKTMIGKLVV